jgi:hypothetical protein
MGVRSDGRRGKSCPYEERKDGELPGQNRDAKGAKLAVTKAKRKEPLPFAAIHHNSHETGLTLRVADF